MKSKKKKKHLRDQRKVITIQNNSYKIQYEKIYLISYPKL